MNSFPELLQGSAWVYFPTAILLGALHGLEPGHSKTMMAAFIIAIRGTIVQAVLLGLAAAVSHSFIIWTIAALALRFGSQWNVETTEPYFQLAGGLIVIGMAIWTFRRMRREQTGHTPHHHHHGEEKQSFLTSLGSGTLDIIEGEGIPPHFRVEAPEDCDAVRVQTVRSGGNSEAFVLSRNGTIWESDQVIPEPHEFIAQVTLSKKETTVSTELTFTEGHAHEEGDDAHAREHAADIAKRFANRTVTTPQIILFGITGGLMPCPAAFSVLIICLQLKRFALGFSLVAAFSLGLAITLVTVGVVAAWSVNKAAQRFSGFNKFARLAPYVSLVVLLCLGTFLAARGIVKLV